MTIHEFVATLNETVSGPAYTYSIERPGVKYTRVVQTSGGSRSVYCFLDAEGNIYKAASWKAPAKGVRSTLATLDVSKLDPYTGWLYR